MDVFLILIGLVILCGLAYIVFKLSNNSNIPLEESHEKKSEELKQMKNILSLEFKNLANEIFEEKSKKFSSNNKETISTILDPLKERIQNFENKVEKSNQANSEWNGRLQEQIKSLKELNLQMSKEAENLTHALKGDSKTQGNWGELQVENILKKVGLKEGIGYDKEKNFKNEDDDNQRPDYIVNLPDGKNIIIDSKVSLTAYANYFNTKNSDEKKNLLKDHVKSVNNHVKSLSEKNYQNLELNQPDYILMFIANEPALGLALIEDSQIYDKALENNIIIVSTSTLLATLSTVAFMWKQDNQNKHALEIARQAGALYDKFCSFSDELIKVGSNIDSTKKTYSDAMKKLVDGKDNLVRKSERLRELGAKASKKINSKLIDRAN
ncbi:MAG: DNA recombination protein RmuC [Bacteroidota bacterium]|nr:DNA recombination protein RmuC [Bacteroidota bacterium]|tara:strand:- start:2465 stop:3610 length:1146 start_codon:yes stop_codon:yes gene_type:complete